MGISFTEIILLLILSIPFLFTIYAIIDASKSQFTSRDTKKLWMLILFFAPVVGTLAYMWLGHRYKANYKNRFSKP